MKRTKKYETVLVITGALLVIWYFKRSDPLLYVALGIGASGMLMPPVATCLDFVWYKVAELFGKITSPLLLGVFFFFVLSPIALSRRLFSKEDRMRIKKNYTTMWKERNHTFTTEDLEKPW